MEGAQLWPCWAPGPRAASCWLSPHLPQEPRGAVKGLAVETAWPVHGWMGSWGCLGLDSPLC